MSDFLKINVDERDQEEAQQALPVADVGELLRSHRLKRNLSQEEVANELRIEVRQLDALENNQYDGFSGTVFVQGYLRNYAKLFDLDPGPILKEFSASTSVGAPPDIVPIKKVMTSHGGGSQIPLSKFTPVILGIVTIVVVMWLGQNLYSFIKDMGNTDTQEATEADDGLAKIDVLERFREAQDQGTDASESSPQLASSGSSIRIQSSAIKDEPVVAPSVATPAPAPEESSVADSEEPIAVIPVQKVTALFRFSEDSWVEAYDANESRLLARIGKAGDEKLIEGVPPIRVVLGNAPGVKVELDGKPFKFRISSRTQVARFKMGEAN